MAYYRYLIFFSFFIFFCGKALRADTWIEPWHDTLVMKAKSLVKARVLTPFKERDVEIEVLENLAGQPIEGKTTISGFYHWRICKVDSNGWGLHFLEFDTIYLWLSNVNSDGMPLSSGHSIATPTAGFAPIKNGTVFSSYRISMQSGFYPETIFKRTQILLFNWLHFSLLDAVNKENTLKEKNDITLWIQQEIAKGPEVFSRKNYTSFVTQNIALEMIYLLKLTGFSNSLAPFLEGNNHLIHIPAVRALGIDRSENAKQLLIGVIENRGPEYYDFTRTLAVIALQNHKLKKADKKRLKKIYPKSSEGKRKFDAAPLDWRICTPFPTEKEALQKLLKIKS